MMGRFAVKFLVGAALVLSAQVANAQNGPTLPASVVASFRANPSQLLTQYPDGGPQMVNEVAGLVSTDRTTLTTIIALAKNANEDQRKAIGAALAQVAKAYAANNPAFANQIQQAVVTSGIPELAKAYASAAGETATASIGGGGAGGGPTGSGPPTGGANTGPDGPGSTFAVTQASSLTGSVLGGGGGISQVSPF